MFDFASVKQFPHSELGGAKLTQGNYVDGASTIFESPWNHINEYDAIESVTITPMVPTQLERASIQENISYVSLLCS